MKNLLKITMVAAFALFAGYNFYQSNVETEETSDIVLANVEALAAGEAGGVTCSAKCSDGIGKCWLRSGGQYCVFSGSMYDSCTGYPCMRTDGSTYYSL